MTTSDALVVGESWISEHYFTTDATSQSFTARVRERRKFWDAEAKEGRATPRSRFTERRVELESLLSRIGQSLAAESAAIDVTAPAEDVHGALEQILEIDGHGRTLTVDGPLVRVSSVGVGDRHPLVLIRALPQLELEDLLAKDGATLPAPVRPTPDADEYHSVARLTSALFVDEHDPPDLVLVLAGAWLLLAERERWPEGRYLAVNLQLVCERNDTRQGGEIDRALTCLSGESIAPDADGNVWWHGVLEESVKHTVGVSQDLRDGVRSSIEIIANDVVRRRHDAGLPPLPADRAQPLAQQSLRFLYRILFLLYAEASPQLGVLPVGAPKYDQGYSLDRLRELIQTELPSTRSQSGTHLYDSLGVLFRLVDTGHLPLEGPPAEDSTPVDDEVATGEVGLVFHALRADLFLPSATPLIDELGLGNRTLQRVLAHLLLSKEKKGRDRGFISYAELGINQLGAVYEGLMSYTGFFAETDLYEVAKGGDGSKGSWVVPVDRSEHISKADFITELDEESEERRPVLHRRRP